eukprot:scaffold259460_cov30-Tisochrysis_lutea.AAC.1
MGLEALLRRVVGRRMLSTRVSCGSPKAVLRRFFGHRMLSTRVSCGSGRNALLKQQSFQFRVCSLLQPLCMRQTLLLESVEHGLKFISIVHVMSLRRAPRFAKVDGIFSKRVNRRRLRTR